MKFNGVRFTNGALLLLVVFLTLSGIYGLFWTFSAFMFTLHRVSGWAVLALLPWKGAIVYRSLRRKVNRRGSRHFRLGRLGISVLLAALTLSVLALGLLWKGRFGPAEYPLRQTAISWHWMLSLGLLLPFGLHVWKHWPRPRRVDFISRRGLLRAGLVSPLALLGYLGYQQVARLRQQPQEPIRFTGSRQGGFYSGNAFPVTHIQAPAPEQITLENWRLALVGAGQQTLSLDYAALKQFPTTELDATLDCTLGWYAQQTWQGARLVDVLEQAGLAETPTQIELKSVTGYAYALPWHEAREVLLATHVSGEVLTPDHGFPLRVVVPSRRGWFWVKWLAEVKVVPWLDGA